MTIVRLAVLSAFILLPIHQGALAQEDDDAPRPCQELKIPSADGAVDQITNRLVEDEDCHLKDPAVKAIRDAMQPKAAAPGAAAPGVAKETKEEKRAREAKEAEDLRARTGVAFKAAQDALQGVPIPSESTVAALRARAIAAAAAATDALKEPASIEWPLQKATWKVQVIPYSREENEDGTTLETHASLDFFLSGTYGDSVAITRSVFSNCDGSDKEKAICLQNAAATLKVARIAQAINHYVITPKVEKNLAEIAKQDAARLVMWEQYFTKTRVQYPWEMVANSHWTFEYTEVAPQPPTWQLIALHPDVALEYVDGAPDGEQFKPAIMAEVIGFNWWGGFDQESGKINTAYGASAIASWTDRDGTQDVRWGIMVHFKSRYSIAWTTGSGDSGVLVSIALGEKARTTQEDAGKLKDALKKQDFDGVCDVVGLGFICGK